MYKLFTGCSIYIPNISFGIHSSSTVSWVWIHLRVNCSLWHSLWYPSPMCSQPHQLCKVKASGMNYTDPKTCQDFKKTGNFKFTVHDLFLYKTFTVSDFVLFHYHLLNGFPCMTKCASFFWLLSSSSFPYSLYSNSSNFCTILKFKLIFAFDHSVKSLILWLITFTNLIDELNYQF